MHQFPPIPRRSTRIFELIAGHPKTVVLTSLLFIGLAGFGLGKLVKDTSVRAFIPDDHPSAMADDRVKAQFGISDTLAVALVTHDDASVFTRERLALIDRLSEALAGLDNVREDRIASLATESSIAGRDGALEVESYIDAFDLTADAAEAARSRWQAMPPHRGTLVSDDGRSAIVMAELVDPDLADRTYHAVLELVEDMAAPGVELHVAGPAAVAGYLSEYIDQDARKLQPLVFVVVLGFMFLAFRSFRALPGPLLVIAGSAAGALGIMAWSGVPYFAITSALPVIIVAISVADAIHVLSRFYQLRELEPEAGDRALVVRAMADMARPITLTTLTTIAGFMGIAAASIMPPITWFAVFAAVGVALAWLFSMVTLPAVLLLVRPGRSRAFASWSGHRPSRLGALLASLGRFAADHHRGVLVAFALISAVALMGALQLRIDRSQVENFARGEPIRVADEIMNAEFAGTAFLDVLIETDAPAGLLSAARMQKILALQDHFESLQHVQKSVSIVDYLSQLHLALYPEQGGGGRALPDSDAAIAQYLFLYELSGDPTDFDDEIDPARQTAFIRGVLDAHYYSETREVVIAMRDYIERNFNEPGMTATLTGDVNLGYHWMQSLETSHFRGVALSLALVLLTAVLVFRSLAAGLIAVVPVLFTVLVLYACMGWLGIYLEPATSMFAAIALGVGVDFAIHLVDRLRDAAGQTRGDLRETLEYALPPVARACFFNSAALGLGFSVLLVSDLPTLERFGGLVALATIASFLVALVIVPALFALAYQRLAIAATPVSSVAKSLSLVLPALILGAVATPRGAEADPAEEGLRVAEQVSGRPEAAAGMRTLLMTLERKSGRSEERRATLYRESRSDRRMTRIVFDEPARQRGFAFLGVDGKLPGPEHDERWMFMPVDGKPRRLPVAKRGDSFFGTDFSFEDMQSELKFNLDDWTFRYLGDETVNGERRHRLSGAPRTERIARELGYGGFTAVIDERSWLPLKIQFMDPRQRSLKTITVDEITLVDGIWTAVRVTSVNHQTDHRTRFLFEDIRYLEDLPDNLFEPESLSRDHRALLRTAAR